jgi:hypothetical protein
MQSLRPLDPELLRCIRQFPFPLGGRPIREIIALLKTYLPPYDVADRLVDAFSTHFDVLFSGISRSQVMAVFSAVYGSLGSSESSRSTPPGDTSSHPLALLFMVFSVGSYVVSLPNERMAIIDHYAQLGLAALGTVPIISSPTLVTVQAMWIRAWFAMMLQTGDEEIARAHLAIACQLCYIVRSPPILCTYGI